MNEGAVVHSHGSMKFEEACERVAQPMARILARVWIEMELKRCSEGEYSRCRVTDRQTHRT